MDKVVVVIGTLFANGNKYRRGDIIEVEDAGAFGTRVQPYVEPPKPKPTPKPKAKATPEAKKDAPKAASKRGITKVTKVASDESK